MIGPDSSLQPVLDDTFSTASSKIIPLNLGFRRWEE
jgi:hypothetical protein